MTHLQRIATLSALALVAACGRGGGANDTAMVSNEIMAADNMASDAMAPLDNLTGTETMAGQQFADLAASSDAYEVEAGRLARDKGTRQAIKDFGAMMVTAHTDSTAKLKAAAAKAVPAITPNPALTPEQDANLKTLRDATGADFDAAYKTQQIAAHQAALAAMLSYAASGDVAEIKAFAAQAAPVVQTHLDKARAL